MPEGPEIRRAADRLEQAIKGKVLTDVWFAFPALQTYQQALVGERVIAIETRGKALLTHFSNGLTLYSHNQLYGVWRVVDSGTEPASKRVLRVRLAAADKTLLLYSASEIELLDADGVGQPSVFAARRAGRVRYDPDRSTGARAFIIKAFSPTSVQRAVAGPVIFGRAGKLPAGGNSLAGRAGAAA